MGVTITWTNGSNKKDQVQLTSEVVKLPKGSYRQIAQKWWKLSDEQMVGMHVHHRIPQAQAGTNWEGNLYVCSQWFHAHIWHGNDEHYANWYKAVMTPEAKAKSWAARKDDWSRVCSLGGKASVAARRARGEQVGAPQNLTPEGRKKGGAVSASKKFRCPHCGMVGNAGNIAKHMRVQGHGDPSTKVKL